MNVLRNGKKYVHLGRCVVTVWTGRIGMITAAVLRGRTGWEVTLMYDNGRLLVMGIRRVQWGGG
jgi:hypothetical protein